jgi:hypothetical protein
MVSIHVDRVMGLEDHILWDWEKSAKEFIITIMKVLGSASSFFYQGSDGRYARE